MVKQFIAVLLAFCVLDACADSTSTEPDITKGVWMIDSEKQIMTNEKGETFPYIDLRQAEAERARNAEALSPLETFATISHQHGISVEEAMKFVGQDYSGLFRLLRDSRYEGSWQNIVAMIGIVGDEKAVDELIAYAEDESSTSWWGVKARTVVPVSLGVIAGRIKSDRLVQYIAEGVDPDKWSQRRDFNSVDPENFHIDAVNYSIEGLAAAGTPKAVKVLEVTSKRLASDTSFRSKMKALRVDPEKIDKSIRKAKRVQAKGYFKAQLEIEKEHLSQFNGK